MAICGGCVDSLAARRPGLVRATPVLATEDLAASAAFWRTAGFDVSVYGPDFATAHRDRIELHLVGPSPGRDRARRTSTYGASTGSTTSGRRPASR